MKIKNKFISGQLLLWTFIVWGCCNMLVYASPNDHQLRSFIALGGMLQCSSQTSGFDLIDYGCFCGKGGKGSHPVDHIDKCCQLHDQCYGRAHPTCKAHGTTSLLASYNWQCVAREAVCYDNRPLTCADIVCKCDASFSLCIKKYIREYNNNYLGYDRTHCH